VSTMLEVVGGGWEKIKECEGRSVSGGEEEVLVVICQVDICDWLFLAIGCLRR
jgi:hypothetical protein